MAIKLLCVAFYVFYLSHRVWCRLSAVIYFIKKLCHIRKLYSMHYYDTIKSHVGLCIFEQFYNRSDYCTSEHSPLDISPEIISFTTLPKTRENFSFHPSKIRMTVFSHRSQIMVFLFFLSFNHITLFYIPVSKS